MPASASSPRKAGWVRMNVTWVFGSVAKPVEQREVGLRGGNLRVVRSSRGGEGAQRADVFLQVILPRLAQRLRVDDQAVAAFHVDEAGESPIAEVQLRG